MSVRFHENPHFPGNFYKKINLDVPPLAPEPQFVENVRALLAEQGYLLGEIRKLQVGRNPCQHRYIVQYSNKRRPNLPAIFYAEGKRGVYEFITGWLRYTTQPIV